jgi:fimbrial chaperone protein
MQISWRIALASIVLNMALLAVPAYANSLSVSPTSITVRAPMAMGQLTLRAGGTDLTLGQVRVMHTDNQASVESMQPTFDVVASPPALRLRPGQEVTVRLVRKTGKPLRGRECYRVLIDQIPQKQPGKGTVGFVIRQSVPLCFVAGN